VGTHNDGVFDVRRVEIKGPQFPKQIWGDPIEVCIEQNNSADVVSAQVDSVLVPM